MTVRRDDAGRLVERAARPTPRPATADAVAESVIHAEVDRQTDPEELDALRGPPAARDRRGARRGRGLAGDAQRGRSRSPPSSSATPAPLDPDERRRDARRSSRWLADHNFTFLGYREYDIVERRRRACSWSPVDGLGPRHPAPAVRTRQLAPLRRAAARGARERALEPYLLNLTKANSRATVHRPAYLDYVGRQALRRRRAGGRRAPLPRPLHDTAYHASPREIPILRRKVDAVLARAAFPHDSHNEKALHRDPRDPPARRAVPDPGRRAVRDRDRRSCTWASASALRLFVRRDTFGRFLSCLVFVPRDRFNTENRRRIEAILQRHLPGLDASTTRRASRSRCSCGCTT